MSSPLLCGPVPERDDGKTASNWVKFGKCWTLRDAVDGQQPLHCCHLSFYSRWGNIKHITVRVYTWLPRAKYFFKKHEITSCCFQDSCHQNGHSKQGCPQNGISTHGIGFSGTRPPAGNRKGKKAFLENSTWMQTGCFLRAVVRAKAQVESRRPPASDVRVGCVICGGQSV